MSSALQLLFDLVLKKRVFVSVLLQVMKALINMFTSYIYLKPLHCQQSFFTVLTTKITRRIKTNIFILTITPNILSIISKDSLKMPNG